MMQCWHPLKMGFPTCEPPGAAVSRCPGRERGQAF